ncbi:MAG: hypothetical protein K0B01_10695 [Syntrophobacterales bacterium]|nr:hypothetical protein [Syntrophobacterales bacterium]
MTLLLFFASLFLSATTGFFLVRILLPKPDGGNASFPLQFFLGTGIGVGISSCIYFLCMITGIIGLAPLLDILLCLLLISFSLQKTAKPPRGENLEKMPCSVPPAKTRLEKLLIAVFSLQALASGGAFFFAFLKEPHGRWDA